MLKSRFVKITLIVLILGFVALEVGLRHFLGLGNMLLYDNDPGYEYLPKPNQDTRRFGHRVVTNEFSMRSLPIASSDTCIVLGFGDSVINGGAPTDQDSLATSIVEENFRKVGNTAFRFLNVSAGSWGPDNCAAYVKKFGSFDAKMIILFVSSHDAHDNMTFQPVVGVEASYPDKQFPLATIELVDRYLWPRFMGLFDGQPVGENLMINKGGADFNPGFQFFKEYCEQNGIPLIVCLHAEQFEVNQGKFSSEGEEVLEFCRQNNIKVIKGLDIGESIEDYRDNIHLNERGQKRWVKALSMAIEETVPACVNSR